MSRSRRVVPGFIALLGLAAFAAAPAVAKVKPHHHPAHVVAHRPPVARTTDFPVYVDQGSDHNPGGDNLYFTDTKNPNYLVGPGWFQRWW